jgi:hypothetical protein
MIEKGEFLIREEHANRRAVCVRESKEEKKSAGRKRKRRS